MVVCGIVVALALMPVTTFANGRVVSFETKTAGPYEVALGTIPGDPSVGNLHLTMSVTEIASDTLVTGADIMVVAVGPPTGTTIGPIAAVAKPEDPTFYDVNTVVDTEGLWIVTTTIRDARGEHFADFEIQVKNVSPIAGIVTLATLLAFLVIFGIAIRASLRGRSTRKKSRA